MKIVKNKTFVCSIILSLIIGNVFFAMTATAASDYTGDVTTTATNEKGKVVFKPNGPFISSMEFSSNLPGAFNYEDFRGNNYVVEDIVPDTEDIELYYPIKQDLIHGWNLDTLQELYTYYANVRNNSDDYGEYSVTLNSIPYDLKANGKDVQFYPTDSISVIKMSASKAGVYQIFVSDLNYNPNNVIILSPSGKSISAIGAQLPPSQQGGTSLGKYFYFATFEAGDHLIYIPTADEVIKLKCEYVSAKSISLGTFYSEGPDPSSNDFLNPIHTFDVYSVSIRDVERYYKYLFDVEYGTPVVTTFIETPFRIVNSGLAQGYNEIMEGFAEGKMYIVIDNPNYFSWPFSGITESNPVKYILKIEEIKPISVPESGTELISLTKLQGVTARTIKVKEMSVLSIGFINKGSNSPTIYTHGGIGVLKRDYNGLLAPPSSIVNLDESANMNYFSALVVPGDYQFALKHSGTTGTEYIEYDIELKTLGSMDVQDLDRDSFINPDNFSNQTIYNWSDVPDTMTDGVGYGVGWNFKAESDLWNFGYNVSIDVSEHGDIFDKTITPALAVMHNETNADSFHYYTTEIQPGNSAAVPVKSEGSSNGDTFLIGSPFKFSSIYVDTSVAATSDDFTWDYWNGGSWTSFTGTHDFVDGTNAGSNSLEQDGTISWNPDNMGNWDFYNGIENNGDNLPDTDGNDLYFIRVYCADNTASTPELNSISMKKYVKIRFDLDTFVSFQSNDNDKKPIYAEIDGHNWFNQNIDNLDDVWSGIDENLDIRLNFKERNAALMIAMGDMYYYEYNGSQTGTLLRLNESILVESCMYKKVNNFAIKNITIGESDIPANYSADVNLTAMPLDTTFSINVTDLDYVYIEIYPRNAYDLTQINLQILKLLV